MGTIEKKPMPSALPSLSIPQLTTVVEFDKMTPGELLIKSLTDLNAAHYMLHQPKAFDSLLAVLKNESKTDIYELPLVKVLIFCSSSGGPVGGSSTLQFLYKVLDALRKVEEKLGKTVMASPGSWMTLSLFLSGKISALERPSGTPSYQYRL